MEAILQGVGATSANEIPDTDCATVGGSFTLQYRGDSNQFSYNLNKDKRYIITVVYTTAYTFGIPIAFINKNYQVSQLQQGLCYVQIMFSGIAHVSLNSSGVAPDKTFRLYEL